jgi:lipopolysaccharide biosynthesis glycosyltransferase
VRDVDPVTVRQLPVVCSITGEYLIPLLVALTSLRAQLKPGWEPTLYLIHTSLDDHQLATIASLVDTHPIVPDPSVFAAIPPDSRLPPEAAAGLFVGELLSETIERAIFLDADTLVMDDLGELLTVDLGGRPLAAAVDIAIPRCSSPRGVHDWRLRGIPEDAAHFNAGVMVIAPREWRDRSVTERTLAYLQGRSRSTGFLHQEALNAVAHDDWARLDGRWNIPGNLAGRPFGPPIGARPGIVHFAGRFKPWRQRIGGPFDDPYRAVLTEVVRSIDLVSPTLREKALAAYDRRFRHRLYRGERFLWERGLI